MKITYILTLAFLVIASVWDIRTRTIPRLLTLLGAGMALAAMVCAGMTNRGTVASCILAAIPGVLLLALSWITEEQIGTGDGICVIIVGLMVGTPLIYLVLMAALLFSSVCAAGLLISRRGNSKSRMPWLPFLTAGLAVSVWTFGGTL